MKEEEKSQSGSYKGINLCSIELHKTNSSTVVKIREECLKKSKNQARKKGAPDLTVAEIIDYHLVVSPI